MALAMFDERLDSPTRFIAHTLRQEHTPGHSPPDTSDENPTDTQVWLSPVARERFFSYVDRNGPAHPYQPELGPCHIWTRARKFDGYGIASIGKQKQQLAHRVALGDALGRPVPAHLKAIHSCDNPPCVNPAHLREATQRENLGEMAARGRAVGIPRFCSSCGNSGHDRRICQARTSTVSP